MWTCCGGLWIFSVWSATHGMSGRETTTARASQRTRANRGNGVDGRTYGRVRVVAVESHAMLLKLPNGRHRDEVVRVPALPSAPVRRLHDEKHDVRLVAAWHRRRGWAVSKTTRTPIVAGLVGADVFVQVAAVRSRLGVERSMVPRQAKGVVVARFAARAGVARHTAEGRNFSFWIRPTHLGWQHSARPVVVVVVAVLTGTDIMPSTIGSSCAQERAAPNEQKLVHVEVLKVPGRQSVIVDHEAKGNVQKVNCSCTRTFTLLHTTYDYDQSALPPNPFPSHVDLRNGNPSSHRRIMHTKFQLSLTPDSSFRGHAS